MHLPTRAPKLEWNLNTIIQIITLLGMIGGGIAIWIDKSRDIEDLQSWRNAHEQVHKDRLGEVKEKEGAFNARLDAGEKNGDLTSRQVDRLESRVAILEQNRDALVKAVQDLQGQLQKIATSQEVSNEILKRLDRAINSKQASP